MSAPRRRLKRVEINLLKHLWRYGSNGIPVTIPAKLAPAILPLWRGLLIDVWYRQDRDAVGGRRTRFISITVDGMRRINALLSAPPKFRASGIHQGQGISHDRSSEPQQGQDEVGNPGGRDARLPQRPEDQD